MARVDEPADPLTPYERAACYYTLPRLTTPVSARFIILYGIVLLALLLALTWAAVEDNKTATNLLMAAVIVSALIGALYIMLLALRNDVRRRKVLRDAAAAHASSPPDETMPDPFAGHVLLQHPGNTRGRLFACSGSDQTIEYFVESDSRGARWRVRTPQDEALFEVRATGGPGSFALISGQPKRLGVYAGDAELARIQDGGTLLQPRIDILDHANDERSYTVRDGGIYLDGRVVGRIYYLRRSRYLDIEREHLREGTLGYFVTLV
ncbi:MAG: hypothetical protein GC168_09075 [Candidatus Hydrogenedens sp.]|nr:hypothetical protein [Candidatus Hydrogenedens sp.]